MTAGRKKGDFLDRYDTPASVTARFLRAWFDVMDNDLQPGRDLRVVLEPAAGSGAMISPLQAALPAADVWAADIEPRNEGILRGDFLNVSIGGAVDLIFTNPPYRLAELFVRRAHELVRDRGWVVMLLRAGFLESSGRWGFWDEFKPVQVFFLRKRPRFTGPNSDGTKTDTAMYAWFVWQKGNSPSYFEGRWV